MLDKTAIIVEDQRNWARLHELKLAAFGFATSTAKSYADAVTLLRQRRFDLAVVDLSLGHQDEFKDLNGIFLLEHLTTKNTPVIIVTAYADRELVDAIFNSFEILAILDKRTFDANKFEDNVVKAAQSQVLQPDDSSPPRIISLRNRSGASSSSAKRRKRISHETIEKLVIELRKNLLPHRPPEKSAATISAESSAAKTRSTRIFISHSSKDNALAERLAKDLRAAGFDVWYDDDQIRVGDTIIDMIAKGVAKCDHMIVILTPAAVESGWVRNELLMFLNEELERNHPVVLPVLYKDCEIPTALKGRRFADFRESYERGFAEVGRSLGL